MSKKNDDQLWPDTVYQSANRAGRALAEEECDEILFLLAHRDGGAEAEFLEAQRILEKVKNAAQYRTACRRSVVRLLDVCVENLMDLHTFGRQLRDYEEFALRAKPHFFKVWD